MNLPQVVILLNWKKQENTSRRYSIHIRVKIGNQARYYKIPTPQKVMLAEWSGEEEAWLKPSHTYAFPFFYSVNYHFHLCLCTGITKIPIDFRNGNWLKEPGSM